MGTESALNARWNRVAERTTDRGNTFSVFAAKGNCRNSQNVNECNYARRAHGLRDIDKGFLKDRPGWTKRGFDSRAGHYAGNTREKQKETTMITVIPCNEDNELANCTSTGQQYPAFIKINVRDRSMWAEYAPEGARTFDEDGRIVLTFKIPPVTADAVNCVLEDISELAEIICNDAVIWSKGDMTEYANFRDIGADAIQELQEKIDGAFDSSDYVHFIYEIDPDDVKDNLSLGYDGIVDNICAGEAANCESGVAFMPNYVRSEIYRLFKEFMEEN